MYLYNSGVSGCSTRLAAEQCDIDWLILYAREPTAHREAIYFTIHFVYPSLIPLDKAPLVINSGLSVLISVLALPIPLYLPI